jgi:hypothetical protein
MSVKQCSRLINILLAFICGLTTISPAQTASPKGGVSPDLCEQCKPVEITVTTSTSISSSLNPSTYLVTVTLTATVSPAISVGTVQFYDGTTALGSPVGVSSGVASYTTSALVVGTHSLSATYGPQEYISGDAITMYTASTSSVLSQTVNFIPQTITVTTPAPTSAVYGSQFTVAATASSGLAVTYSSSGGCTNSGATFTMTSATTACAVTYSQAGNSSYATASNITSTTNASLDPQTFTVQTPAPASAVYGTQFAVAAAASSGLTVTYSSSGGCTNSGATFTMTSGVTACTVTYSQAGNSDYSASSVSSTTNATPATPSITWTTPADINYGTSIGSAQSDAILSTSSTCVYTPAGGTVLPVGVNTLSASCTPTDTTDYLPGPYTASVSLTVLPVILSVSPNSGPPGTLVTITGSGFANAQGTVVIEGVDAAVVDWQSATITAWLPNSLSTSTSPALITVTVNGQSNSNSIGFTVTGASAPGGQCGLTQ